MTVVQAVAAGLFVGPAADRYARPHPFMTCYAMIVSRASVAKRDWVKSRINLIAGNYSQKAWHADRGVDAGLRYPVLAKCGLAGPSPPGADVSA